MDLIKNLTGKDPKAYIPVAEQIINKPDVELFKELVSRDDFLFDFIKRNVAQRLEKACNKDNYKNLYQLLKIYSPYYDEFLSSTIAQFANNDDTFKMFELLKNGSDAEKTYAASFFSYVENLDAQKTLKEYAFSDNSDLANNCAKALGKIEDKESYELAITKLKSGDSFEEFSATKFLISYQNKDAIKDLFETMKKSGMAENIAAEIPFLQPLTALLNTEFNDEAILAFCHILNGLSELIPLANIIEYDLYSFVDLMIKSSPSGASAVALISAKEKFNLLAENDEYLFDEDKNTKNEIKDINILLKTINVSKYNSFIYEELFEESDFIFFAIELIKDEEALISILDGKNQTVILKALIALKSINKLNENHKKLALEHISDENIKNVAKAL